jgi:hypothetical protein
VTTTVTDWFEEAVAKKFRSLGWHVVITHASNDHEIDLLCRRGNECAAVQCKDTSKPVGSEVFQKLDIAMRQYPYGKGYKFYVGVVVSTSGFSQRAIDWVYEHNNTYKYKRFKFIHYDPIEDRRYNDGNNEPPGNASLIPSNFKDVVVWIICILIAGTLWFLSKRV